MEQKENKQLNWPVKRFFSKKMRCTVSRNEFKFAAGELDVLAYDRKRKCFHICEGKRASNVASVGHAVGQLIAYMSLIQENGYDFLDRITKEERLELSDFASFLENRAIDACFYVALPSEYQDKIYAPAKLMLNNLGEFGSSIGVFFASKKQCKLLRPAKPISIKIRKVYSKNEFFDEIVDKIMSEPQIKRVEENKRINPNVIQLKEKSGNPFLHYEVWLRKNKKQDTSRTIEVAFHLEFAKAHLHDKTGVKRKKKIQKILRKSVSVLKSHGLDYVYQNKWGKRWARLYKSIKTEGLVLDDHILSIVLDALKNLIIYTKPMLDKINWGRLKGSVDVSEA